MERNDGTDGDLFKSLLIDERAIKKEIENKARRVFMLDHNGRVVFKVSEKDINNKQIIGIHFIGRYIAHELGIVDDPMVSADVLASLTGFDIKTVRARVSDLKKQNIVESPERGVYRVTLIGADKLLEEILTSKGDNNGR